MQFTIPGIDNYTNPATLTKPQELAAWINELPYANQQGTVQLLHKMLAQINRHPELIPERYQLMLLLLQPFQQVICTVIEKCQGREGENYLNNERAFDPTIEQTITEMAYGFKHLINNIQSDEDRPPSTEVFANVIYHTIDLLSLNLLFSYSRYKKTSQTIWREINQLHELATRYDLCDIGITTDDTATSPSSIKQAFTRIALIVLLDPFRLKRGEVWHAYHYLSSHAHLVRLGPWRALAEGNTEGCFQLKYGSL
ncbi:MAG: hypothetical protein MI754_01310, partial [Chromatiales bacterium]|nr:hypothetical protein [Chromatiales bacterium]